MIFAMKSAPKYKEQETMVPKQTETKRALIKILCALLYSPFTFFAAIIFDTATGMP